MTTAVYAPPSVTVSQFQSLHRSSASQQHAPPWHMQTALPGSPSLPNDADVIHAVSSGEGLRMVYQPQYDLHDKRIVSAEALLRWRHPQYGEIPPSVLIPMVNRLGLHLPLFDLVVTQVIDMLRNLRSIGADVPVAVNASVDTICEPGMADYLSSKMWHACLPSSLLKIEMTEDLPVFDELCLSAGLNALQAKGFPLSLDDFGAGYATLNLLVNMPFDEVKIDGAFIREMETSTHSHAIVATIITLARTLNLKLVAEGIENAAMIKALRSMGCCYGQGYALSPPMERAAFLQHQLANNTAIELKSK